MSKEKKVICHNHEDETIEVDSSKIIWRPSVYGILIQGDKILLLPQQEGYDFPGGGAEIYETIEETLKREFWEETGFKIEVKEILHCETSFFAPKFHKEYWNCPLMYFLVERVSGELSTANFDEHEKKYARMAEWVDIGKIDDVIFSNGIDSPALIKKVYKDLEEKNGK